MFLHCYDLIFAKSCSIHHEIVVFLRFSEYEIIKVSVSVEFIYLFYLQPPERKNQSVDSNLCLVEPLNESVVIFAVVLKWRGSEAIITMSCYQNYIAMKFRKMPQIMTFEVNGEVDGYGGMNGLIDSSPKRRILTKYLLRA